MGKNGVFGSIRRLTDTELQHALDNHAAYLNGLVNYVTITRRERRLWLVWGAVVTLVLLWLGVSR